MIGFPRPYIIIVTGAIWLRVNNPAFPQGDAILKKKKLA
jgi:hypothetical protein